MLGDGSVHRYEIYEADLEWDGNWVPVFVSAIGDGVLVGTGLLAGHEVRVVFEPGGAVEISPYP